MQLTKKNDWFSNFFTDFLDDKRPLDTFRKNVIPSVNLLETDADYTIEVCAPGIKKDDLKISVDDDLLSISYSLEEEKVEKDKAYTKKEFVYRSFQKTATIPNNVLKDEITANFDNGILYIKLPKDLSKKTETKEIEIS